MKFKDLAIGEKFRLTFNGGIFQKRIDDLFVNMQTHESYSGGAALDCVPVRERHDADTTLAEVGDVVKLWIKDVVHPEEGMSAIENLLRDYSNAKG